MDAGYVHVSLKVLRVMKSVLFCCDGGDIQNALVLSRKCRFLLD